MFLQRKRSKQSATLIASRIEAVLHNGESEESEESACPQARKTGIDLLASLIIPSFPLLQSLPPFEKNTSCTKDRYFEVTVRAVGPSVAGCPPPACGVGVVYGASPAKDAMPGWHKGALGFHGDDYKLYDGSGIGVPVDGLAAPSSMTFGTTLGCGILETSASIFSVVFTLNGKVVYKRELAADFDTVIASMRFSVGLLGVGVKVELNAGAEPFRYTLCNLPGVHPSLEADFIKFDPFAPRLPAGPTEDVAAAILRDAAIRKECSANGIDVMSVTWEDTGRTKGSCFGPNISDMTLCCGGRNMPVFRKPNFADLTSDQDLTSFYVVVGNEESSSGSTSTAKRSITLSEYLTDIGKYIGRPDQKSLLAKRDSKILTSAQACVLPLTEGKVEFNVAIFNYQSFSEPAVLVIVCSSEGTSAEVVLGRDTKLSFNKHGRKADFTATRLSDDRKSRGVPLDGPMTEDEKLRNCLLIFQVPLKVKPSPRPSPAGFYLSASMSCAPTSASFGAAGAGRKVKSMAAMPRSCAAELAPSRGLEAAMLGTTEGRGTFEGVRGFSLVRDEDFPIRCTLQFYHCVDRTADLTATAIKDIATQVSSLYDASAPWNRGSLVTTGSVDSGRVTEHSSSKNFASTIGFALPPGAGAVPAPLPPRSHVMMM